MTVANRQTYWDLLETLQWIGTRDKAGIAAMGDINEQKRTPLAIFTAEAVLDAHAVRLLAKYDFTDYWQLAERQAGRKSLDVNESGMIGPGQALNYVLQQVHSRRIRMTAIKCDRHRVRQVPVPPAELDDLEFRINSDHRLAKVGLWSRSHNTLLWRSPQFLRADIIRVWPTREKKSAAVSGVILQHLQTIMTSSAPLTRAEAQRRCLVEVPDAYPGAFKKAWAILGSFSQEGTRHARW